MKHWLSLVNVPEVDQYLEIARFAEQVGFYGVSVADHLVMPLEAKSRYPYTPDGDTWWPDDIPWPDPWVTLAAMAATTSKLRFTTNIYLAALRDPFTAAKAVSTAAVLSGNRVICGVSAGWLREEFELIGVDFDSRGRRLDEMLVLMRQLWSGQAVDFHGEFFQVQRALMSPAPTETIQIWSGGASPPALRRAAANDGWLGVPMAAAQLLETIDKMKDMRKQAGLQDKPFDVCFSLMEPLTPGLAEQLQGAGADNNMVLPWMITPWGRSPWLRDGEDPASLTVKKRVMERFAGDIIEKY